MVAAKFIKELNWSFFCFVEDDLVRPLILKFLARFGVDGFDERGIITDEFGKLSFGLLIIIDARFKRSTFGFYIELFT